MIFCWPTSFELLNRAWLLASGTWHCRFRIAQLRHEARAVAKEATAPPPPPPAVPPVPPAAPEEAPEAPEVTVAAKEPEMPQELRASGHVWAMGCYGWLNGFDSRNFTSFHIILSVSLQIAVQMAFLSLHFCRDLERGAYHWCCKRSVYRGFAVDQENSMNWLELHVLFQDASFVAESLFISISVMQGHLGRPKTDMEIDQWVTAICASPTCEAPEIGGHSFPVAHATCNFRGSSQDLPRGEGEGLAVLDKAQRNWKNALESTRIKMRSGATGSDREWEEMIGKHGEDCWGIFISFHFPVPKFTRAWRAFSRQRCGSVTCHEPLKGPLGSVTILWTKARFKPLCRWHWRIRCRERPMDFVDWTVKKREVWGVKQRIERAEHVGVPTDFAAGW